MRSKLEQTCADLLTAHGILYEYERQRVVLQTAFEVTYPCYEREGKLFKKYTRKMLAVTYTPDFVGDGWVIETKGYERESSKIKWKMFKRYLEDKGINVTIFKPHTKGEILECIAIILKDSPNKTITCLK